MQRRTESFSHCTSYKADLLYENEFPVVTSALGGGSAPDRTLTDRLDKSHAAYMSRRRQLIYVKYEKAPLARSTRAGELWNDASLGGWIESCNMKQD